ncbi:MAG: sodium-dependent transporter [Ruminococcaceae bacterium]|nr:sodium-dependent transporter [Oscillospiraceae bacterium]
MSNRENFKSSLGFILVSAGCAIGIGNVWKFPYVAGANGGGVFVLFYFLFLLIMGVPVLTMELAVGRASRQSAIGAYKALEKPGHKWHIHGWFCTIGCYLLMMYYTTVSGWMLGYFLKFASGTFEGIETKAAVDGVFESMLANPVEMIIYMAITVIAGFLVCSFSLQKGLERISKVIMLGLLGLIVILVVNSLLLDGAAEGVKFYLLPDFKSASKVGIMNVMVAAMNQSFFTLSIGIASMEIFGSYMTKDKTITGESIRICSLDTFVAVMSGLIIFPACTAFGVAPDSGPSLIFKTLPNIFVNMAGGRIWGSLFFVFMTFASFSTVIAVFQNLIAACEENFGWSKKTNIIINAVFMVVASLPCVLGFNVLSGVTLGGMNILDIEDFIVSTVLLPAGALVYLLFCVTKYGWGFDKYLAECNTGSGMKMSERLKPYFKFVLPILILIIFGTGIYNFVASLIKFYS